MEFLDKISALLDSALATSAVVATVVEFVLRLFPTHRPLSIAHFIASLARGGANVLGKFADLLDKVLPQTLKEPPAA